MSPIFHCDEYRRFFKNEQETCCNKSSCSTYLFPHCPIHNFDLAHIDDLLLIVLLDRHETMAERMVWHTTGSLQPGTEPRALQLGCTQLNHSTTRPLLYRLLLTSKHIIPTEIVFELKLIPKNYNQWKLKIFCSFVVCPLERAVQLPCKPLIVFPQPWGVCGSMQWK